jgi:geranylgeranyl diphosphate synthase type II
MLKSTARARRRSVKLNNKRPQQHASTEARVPTLVTEMLHEYGGVTRAALANYLPKGYPGRYLYDLLSEYPRRGGKMMRPGICIATARSFGAALSDALPTAVAIELLHNAMLIHDDVQDESSLRRGRPTLHSLYGVPLAINAGDALFLLGLRPLLDNLELLGASVGARILRETENMAWNCSEGQALELGWRGDNRVNLEDGDYLTMVLKKTCWLGTIYPLRVGAIIGTRGAIDLDQFVRFGFFLGASFQIQDDLLNFNAKTEYGKEADGDLYEGKRSLVIIHALRRCSAYERQQLTSLLGHPREKRSTSDIEWIRMIIDKYESIDYARRIACSLAGAALFEFDTLFQDQGPSRDRAFIRALANWVFARTK